MSDFSVSMDGRIPRRGPDYVYSEGSATLGAHLDLLGWAVTDLIEKYGHGEPCDIETRWQDEDEYTGWVSVIHWPVVVVSKNPEARA